METKERKNHETDTFCSIQVFSSVLQAGRGRFCVSHRTKVYCIIFSHIIIPAESKTPVFRQTLAFYRLVYLAEIHFCFKTLSRRLLSKCTAFSCKHVGLITDNLLTCKKCEREGKKKRGQMGGSCAGSNDPFLPPAQEELLAVSGSLGDPAGMSSDSSPLGASWKHPREPCCLRCVPPRDSTQPPAGMGHHDSTNYLFSI